MGSLGEVALIQAHSLPDLSDSVHETPLEHRLPKWYTREKGINCYFHRRNMREDFAKRKAALWRKWEKAGGRRIPEDLRAKWEEAAGVEDDAHDPEVALRDLNGIIEDRLDEFELLETRNYFSNRRKPRGSATGKRYQRPFEKRLYLVRFVMERYLTKASWGHRSVYSRRRIDWRQMATEWNEAHPSDHMSKEVLKVRYYRAIAEEDIQREYIKGRFIRVPMNVGAEIYDYVKITDSEGNERIGNIGSIVRRFENGEFTMDIRLVGDELSSEKSGRDAKRGGTAPEVVKKVVKSKGGKP